MLTFLVSPLYKAPLHFRHPSAHNFCSGSKAAQHRRTVSAAIRMQSEGRTDDLLIVGAGVLGRLVAAEWQKLHPAATVTGETRTTDHHDELLSLGIKPALCGSTNPAPPNVIYCAPPSGSTDYAQAVSDVVQRAKESHSRMVFTSSTSVYGNSTHFEEDTARISTDYTSVAEEGSSRRVIVLVNAENSVLSYENGIVVRLTGLYTAARGPHSYWLRVGSVKSPASGKINLINYHDAARGVVQALNISFEQLKSWPRRACLLVANTSISRRNICDAALRHPLYEDCKMPEFASSNDDDSQNSKDQAKLSRTFVSRTFDNSWTRSVLRWTPEWESFADFMEHDASVCLSANRS